MGLGRFGGGVGAARYLLARGAEVTVTDLAPADTLATSVAALDPSRYAPDTLRLVLGEHRDEDFERADCVVANPAVRPDHPLLERARANGARVTTEIELFLEELASNARFPRAKPRVACVTGTQGKSSTCHILHSLAVACGERAHLGGNIGASLLETLDDIHAGDVVVLEVSSYQLAALGARATTRVAAAVAVTGILADHLERHGTIDEYALAKQRILELLHDGGVALLPARDAIASRWTFERGRDVRFGATNACELALDGGSFTLGGEVLATTDELLLPGDFQRENALVALGLARLLGMRADALRGALADVRGLPHRLEALGTFRGRRVHDNAVSTTPDSTIAALESLPRGTTLIAGGRSKALPWDGLVRVARERVAGVVCFGEAGDEIAHALAGIGVRVERVATVEDALASALEHAPAGSDVLFSPACSSFDAYPNFRARALAFRAALPTPDAGDSAHG